MVVFTEFFAERRESGRGAVFEHLTVDVFQHFESGRRGGDVGLSDVEMVDLYASGLGVAGKRGEAADW